MKRIPPITLLVSPYLLSILIYILIDTSGFTQSYEVDDIIFTILVAIGALIYVFNIVFAIVMFFKKESSEYFMLWAMVLKVCTVPLHVIVLIIGLIMSLVPDTLNVIYIAFLVNYIIMIPSSVYGIVGVIQARRERIISLWLMILNICLQALLMTDLISSIWMYAVVKAHAKKVQSLSA